MGGFYSDLLREILKLVKVNSLDIKCVAEYLNFVDINKALSEEKDLLDNEEDILKQAELLDKSQDNIPFIHLTKIIAEKIIDSYLSDDVYLTDSLKLLYEIEEHCKIRGIKYSAFSRELILNNTVHSGFDLNNLRRSLRDRAPRDGNIENAKKIIAYIDARKSPDKHDFWSNDVVSCLMYKLKHNQLTEKESSNLCGDYFMIRRHPYIVGDDTRNLYITTIKFYPDNDGVVRFKYLKKYNDKFLINTGIVIRDTHQSLKLIGFVKVDDSYRSLKTIGLSASVENLESGSRKYINGGIFGNDDSNAKPYHTWVHLSKINDQARFDVNVGERGIWHSFKQYEPTIDFTTIMITMHTTDFIISNEHVKEFAELTEGNDPNATDKTLYIESAIYKKLFLNGVIPSFSI